MSRYPAPTGRYFLAAVRPRPPHEQALIRSYPKVALPVLRKGQYRRGRQPRAPAIKRIVHKTIVAVVIGVQATLRTDPEATVCILEQAVDVVVDNAVRIGHIMLVYREPHPVIPVQAVTCRKPHQPGFIFGNIQYRTMRKPVLYVDTVKRILLRPDRNRRHAAPKKRGKEIERERST